MVKIVYGLISLGLIFATVFGFLGFVHPAFDTFAHFRWHFGLALLAFAILGAVLKIQRAPIIVLFFSGIAIWMSNAGNRHTLDSVPIIAEGQQSYSMLTFNLRFDNEEHDAVIKHILDFDADILSLTETSRQWMPALEPLKEQYPHQFHCPEWSLIGGSMIWSKFPMRHDDDYCHAYAALGVTEIQLNNHWIPIGIVHLRWPWPASGPKQIEALGPYLSTIGETGIISGDFNATTWSWAMVKFSNYAGMKITAGFGGTWMHNILPVALAPSFGLPIDNVMAKGDIVVSSVKAQSAPGSDHLSLLIEFALN